MNKKKQECLIKQLNIHQNALYGLFDSARDRDILPLLKGSGEKCQSLFQGTRGDLLADVAPWLVKFSENSGFLKKFMEKGWGNSWGIFFAGEADFAMTRRHFRQFLFVDEMENGNRLYFRFYDPRVFRMILPIYEKKQLVEFFTFAGRFFVEDEDPSMLLQYSLKDNELETQVTDLEADSESVNMNDAWPQ